MSNAIYIEDYWRLTTSALISGFEIDEENGKYFVELSFDIDFESPSDEIIKDVDSGSIKETIRENDHNIEIEVELFVDEEYQLGQYKLIFNVTDENTFSEAKGETTFILDDDRKPKGY
ncbi:MAG: hypothetical protein U5K00_15040 [Melioribacteraceae bacterium]|nr:hypothetical protein [Melioribacteraceae bacterium]